MIIPRTLFRGLALMAINALVAIASAASLNASVVDDTGTPVGDAVVVAVPAIPGPVSPARPAAVEQIDAEFMPTVKAVQVGSSVSFPNRDTFGHHVYSFSPAKRFELPIYQGVAAKPVVFDKPGPVVLGCNIHDWMRGYIYVSESPYFAITGGNGSATIASLPAGTYALRVWHPRVVQGEDATQRTVELGTGADAQRWTVKLRPDTRIRRAPVSSGGGYR